MKLESKYNLNQVVYHIANRKESKWIPCIACNGEGTIILNDNKPRNCPDCYGRKGEKKYFAFKWEYDMSLTVGEIRIKATNLDNSDSDFGNIGSYKEGLNKQENIYMTYETGIGSGNLWDEIDLFGSIEDARTECDKRNGLTNSGRD